MDFLKNFSFDKISFFLGFFTATIFWWLFTKLKEKYKEIREPVKERVSNIKEKNVSGIEAYVRTEIYNKAQKLHLAHQLFSLDEILIKPKLIASPIEAPPDQNLLEDNIANQILPYQPDTPELYAEYSVATLRVTQALLGGSNLVIIGKPGTGKTVALAHIASLIAIKDSSVGKLIDFVPILLHHSEIAIENTADQDPLEIIINAINYQISGLVQNRFPDFIKSTLKNKRLLLLLDGFDELPPQTLQSYVQFLSALTEKHPQIRYVVTADPNYMDGLTKLDCYPLAIAPWSKKDYKTFLNTWANLWNKHIVPTIKKTKPVDFRLLVKWLEKNNGYFTPLEHTLRVWAAFAGDNLGPTSMHDIEAYIQRITLGAVPHLAMETIAYEQISSQKTSFTIKQAEKVLSQIKLGASSADVSFEQFDYPETSPISDNTQKQKRKRKRTVSTRGKVLSILINSGLVFESLYQEIRISHPIFSGYLASYISAQSPEKLPTEYIDWATYQIMLQYLAAQTQAIQWAANILKEGDDIFNSRLLSLSYWLRNAPTSYQWRSTILRRLVKIIQNEALPFSIRSRALTAIIITNDHSLSALFKQLLSSKSAVIRTFAALGSGAIHSTSNIDNLIHLLSDPTNEVRTAAMMAIAAMDSKDTKSLMEEILISGEENLRLVAAEWMANNPPEGHDILKEILLSEDILARRAAVFGLSKIRRKWVIPLLEKTSIEDGQWVVRNAASQALDTLQKPDPHIPIPLPAPEEAPWVIEFASKLGLSVSPSEPATGTLLLALQSQYTDEIIYALNFLRKTPEPEVINQISSFITTTQDTKAQEAALLSLWFFISGGSKISNSQL